MSKAEGKIVSILFTDKLINDVSGNEDAFEVTGQEYEFVDGPDNNGPLVDKTYSISSTSIHPSNDKILQLNMENPFNNRVGNLRVKYTQSLGNLAGSGGLVLDFEETFTPTDLISKPLKVGTHENLTANVGASILLQKLIFTDTYEKEHLTANVASTINLYELDDAPI